MEKKECQHKKIMLVFSQGKPLGISHDKDLLLRCVDCDKELFRISTYGKEIINCLP